jgi:hypothetical protein
MCLPNRCLATDYSASTRCHANVCQFRNNQSVVSDTRPANRVLASRRPAMDVHSTSPFRLSAVMSQHCETIRHDSTSELPYIRLQLVKFWMKACTCSCNDLPPEALQWRKWWRLCKEGEVLFNETKTSQSHDYSGDLGRNLEWILLLISPFMHFAKIFARRVVCVDFRFRQNVSTELEYQLDAYRFTNSTHSRHP